MFHRTRIPGKHLPSANLQPFKRKTLTVSIFLVICKILLLPQQLQLNCNFFNVIICVFILQLIAYNTRQDRYNCCKYNFIVTKSKPAAESFQFLYFQTFQWTPGIKGSLHLVTFSILNCLCFKYLSSLFRNFLYTITL